MNICFFHIFSDFAEEKETMAYFAAHFEQQLKLYRKQVSLLFRVHTACGWHQILQRTTLKKRKKHAVRCPFSVICGFV